MTSLDHHTLMHLKLERWNQGRPLRAFEIEREIAALRAPKPVRPRRKFQLSPFWRRATA